MPSTTAPRNSPITVIQRSYAPIRKLLPRWLAEPIRRVTTALLTPLLFSTKTGHLRSSLAGTGVDASGAPVPFYTYPAIDFLRTRDFSQATVLEFGAGNSTLWWARHARHVVALEGDPSWYERIKATMPANVTLILVDTEDSDRCLASVEQALGAPGMPVTYDVSVIDGLWRSHMVPVALDRRSETGVILVDDCEGYEIIETMQGSGLCRVDFIGYGPGVVNRRATSLYFDASSPLVADDHPLVIGRLS